MGKHRLRSSGDDNDDKEFPTLSGKLEDEKESRTFERDSGGVQGIEYFGVDTRED